MNALRRTTRSILWDKREDQVGKVLEDMYQAREAELQFLNNEIGMLQPAQNAGVQSAKDGRCNHGDSTIYP